MKMRAFIGSSGEAHRIALAVQAGLERHLEATIWDQSVFIAGTHQMASLVEILHRSDFGVFIFAADDKIQLRNKRYVITRDNVVFETGLFAGHLDPERCFVLRPANSPALHLPTDLAGITVLTYDLDREEPNPEAAVATACIKIAERATKLGRFSLEERAFAIDPATRGFLSYQSPAGLQGLWLSRLSLRPLGSDLKVKGFRFAVEELQPQGERSLHGRTLLHSAGVAEGVDQAMRSLMISGQMLGKWYSVATQSMGTMQLRVHSRQHVLSGVRSVTSDTNEVQVASWEWLRLDLGKRSVRDAVQQVQHQVLQTASVLNRQFDAMKARHDPMPLRLAMRAAR